MRIAPRTVAAALGAAAIAITSLLQPTPAAAQEYKAPELIIRFARLAGPIYDDGLQGAEFAIRNRGTAMSSPILVWRKCGYWKFQEKNGNWSVVHYEKSMPPLVLPALPKSYATTILVQCPRDEGMAPEHVKVMLAAQVGEIVTDDNTASHSF